MKNTHPMKLYLNVFAIILMSSLYVCGQGYGGSRASETNDNKTTNADFFGAQTFSIANATGDLNALDPNFGTNGVVTADFNSGIDLGWGIARQSDGKIVACGGSYNTNYSQSDFAVVRFNVNGTVDTTFGTNGKVTTNIGTVDVASGQLAIQPDGKIVVGGYANNRANGAIVRYNPNGSLDTTFGTGGIVTYALGSPTNDEGKVLLQPDGKIVFIGIMGAGAQQERQYLVRLNPNGSFDSTFGTNGLVVTNFGDAVSRGYDGVILPDGKILAFGWTANFQLTNARVAVARYNANGTLDTTFNGTGFVLTGASGFSLAVYSGFVQPDGKIVVAGRTLASPEMIIVLRYNADGTLDTTFGSTGIVTVNSANRSLFGNETLYANGKIYVSGSIGTTNPQARLNDFLTVRFNLNGTFDTTFSNGGVDVTSLTPGDDQILDLLLQPNGQLLALGLAEVATETADFALIRFKLEGITRKRPADFDGDGRADLSVFRPSNGTWYIARPTGDPAQNFDSIPFGQTGDKLVPADYDGDGKTDVAVFRSGTWYLQRSSQGFTGVSFGTAEDIPVPADYDGDGKADVAVFRPSNATWYLLQSSNGFAGVQFGISTDKPVPADYDGDGKTDISVNRSGIWYINGSQRGFYAVSFGTADDKLVPADYDGDGKADLAVFRPSNGTWYLQQSTAGFTGIQFGQNGDAPVAADYDGDGKADVAVFRAGTWYLQRSTAGFTGVSFGISNDLPTPNAFVR